MFRFKLSALLLSLLARLGLSEPQYSILDESSSKWLPEDILLTGLNTLYNSLFQSVNSKDDKKKRPVSAIAAAIVEYLSTDLADEQAKLNSALNARRITTKSMEAYDFSKSKKTVDKLPKTDSKEKIDFKVMIGNKTDVKEDVDWDLKSDEIDDEDTTVVDNDDQQQFTNDHKQLLRTAVLFLDITEHL